MKSHKLQFFALAAFVLSLALLTVAGTAEARPRHPRAAAGWVLLGERQVSDRVDHDVINVTAARGDFRSLRVEVRGHAVQFRRMTVHFGNGGRQEVELRDVIPAGGQSRVIDLEGRDRVIRSIDFTYDAETRGRGKRAHVLVYGKV
jgi:hypothetical protein